MRIEQIGQSHPVSVVANDAAEGLKGVIQSLEDHLLNEIDFTREKIVSSNYSLKYIMEMLIAMRDRIEILERRAI